MMLLRHKILYKFMGEQPTEKKDEEKVIVVTISKTVRPASRGRHLKGSVSRDLKGVKSGTNREVFL